MSSDPDTDDMTMKTTRKSLIAAVLACALALLVPVRAYAQPVADGWTFSVMPYLWLPSLSGKLRRPAFGRRRSS
jgi:hypothetical protein